MKSSVKTMNNFRVNLFLQGVIKQCQREHDKKKRMKKKRGNKECVCMHECVYTVEGGRERKQSNKFSCRKTSDMTPQKASQGQLSPA